MNEQWIEQLRHNLDGKSTEELLQIWQDNNREEYSDEAFIAIGRILAARGETPGPQLEQIPPVETPEANYPKRPGFVTFFALLVGIGAALYALLALLGLYLANTYTGSTGTMEAILVLVFSGLNIGVAVGLWYMKNWARYLVMALLILNMILLVMFLFSGALTIPAALGLIFAGYSLYWFARNGAYFGKQAT
jgi:hypothetical protein